LRDINYLSPQILLYGSVSLIWKIISKMVSPTPDSLDFLLSEPQKSVRCCKFTALEPYNDNIVMSGPWPIIQAFVRSIKGAPEHRLLHYPTAPALAASHFIIEVERIFETGTMTVRHARYFVPLCKQDGSVDSRNIYVEVHPKDLFNFMNPHSVDPARRLMTRSESCPDHQPKVGKVTRSITVIDNYLKFKYGHSAPDSTRDVSGEWLKSGPGDDWGTC
jgi:hypothetical protein